MTLPGIAIVTYNSEACIVACLEAAATHADQIVVVDNASSDNTVALVKTFPQVVLVRNTANRGFAAAVNQATEGLDSEFILLLNPDAVLQTSLEALVKVCGHAGYAAAGGLLLDPDGIPQSGFMTRRFPTPAALAFEVLGINALWPSNPVNRHHRCVGQDPLIACDTEQPAGAFLMYRRALWKELKGFDERFFPIWFEDVDFLVRARDAGYLIRYEPAAVAIHQGAHSIDQLQANERIVYWYNSLLAYAAKHFDLLSFRAVAAAVFCGAATRIPARPGCARGYAKVMRFAARALISGSVKSK
jgi:GT2 family glycosyltransferase